MKKARFHFIKGDYTIDLDAINDESANFNKEHKIAFDDFKEDIEKELKRLPLVGSEMPKSWANIRNVLLHIGKERPYLSRQDFIKICEENQCNSFEEQMKLSSIFHDLGVFLHFQEHSNLEDFIILQNVWATDAVFAVLDNVNIKTRGGRFYESEISTIWKNKNYEQITHKKLLSLMMQFELCYLADEAYPQLYIIPEMLNESPPVGYKWVALNDLPLIYDYDFLPKGILTRFIVRLHRNIFVQNGEQVVWKTGVKLDGKLFGFIQTFAEVTIQWDFKSIKIAVQGPYSRELMNIIMFHLDELSDKFFKETGGGFITQNSKYHKKIPCNCNQCKNSEDKAFYQFDELMERRNNGKDYVDCTKPPAYNIVEIAQLLDGVFIHDKAKQSFKAKNIFISYATEDKLFKNELLKHFAPLQTQKLITIWNDELITPGYWGPQIETALNEADIYLFLLSANALSSEYINQKELRIAYERFILKKAQIILVLCSPCDWNVHVLADSGQELHPLFNKPLYPWMGKLQCYPHNGLPIEKWPNRNDAYLEIVEAVKKIL